MSLEIQIRICYIGWYNFYIDTLVGVPGILGNVPGINNKGICL